jgi:hypothetical protein
VKVRGKKKTWSLETRKIKEKRKSKNIKWIGERSAQRHIANASSWHQCRPSTRPNPE